jgi:hypothetical protein
MPDAKKIDLIMEKLQLETPIIAAYDAEVSDDFAPLVTAKGRACCFAFFKRWLKGDTLVVEKGDGDFANPDSGCPGMQVAFGLKKEYPSFMKHFLTDGEGAPKGEGLKATPDLAQEFIDHAKPPKISGTAIMLGPLRLQKWDSVRSLTFFVDADRLAALVTLATYHSGPEDVVVAPFSSGCGLMLRELESYKNDPAIIGCTDIAMRKYIPANLLCLTVSPDRFEKMMSIDEKAFLYKGWWADLMNARK